jgi:signal transduction histidine kinase
LLLVISLFLGLGGLIYLSIYTGKGREGERIKLYWLDYIPYEFQIGFLLLFTLIPLNISSSIYDPKEQYFLLIILCGILNIWVLLAIHIFLSMIRNLKNQRLGHNILCVRILMGMINMFKNMIKSYKPWLIIVFFGICLINMIFALLIPSGPFSVFAGFVLFNVLVLKILVRYLRGLQYLMDATHARARGGLEYPLKIQELPEAFQDFGADLNAMQSGLRAALEEAMRGERMKTELITNVTHDLKNPLTSIINYVDLLKKEDMPSEEAKGYIAVLEDKAKRLKDLISHVVEASKASSGNIEINKEVIDIKQLMQQILAEYEDEFEGAQLDVVMQVADEPVTMNTDSKVMYRIIENLVTNIHKYSMRGSRVYITLGLNQEKAVIEMKNISKDPLNINTEALMERFVRGDASRNTEGSGLGLSIARSLAKALDLNLTIETDGDLFKTKLT